MKKFSKWLLLLATTVAAIVCAFAFAACGDDNKEESVDYSKYAGTYKFEKYVWDMGVIKTYKVGDVIEDYIAVGGGGVTLTADYFVMVLGDDGTFTVNSPLTENNPQVIPYGNEIHGNMTGTWKPTEYSLTVTIDGKEIISSHLRTEDDGVLIYSFSGTGLITHSYYLKKV